MSGNDIRLENLLNFPVPETLLGLWFEWFIADYIIVVSVWPHDIYSLEYSLYLLWQTTVNQGNDPFWVLAPESLLILTRQRQNLSYIYCSFSLHNKFLVLKQNSSFYRKMIIIPSILVVNITHCTPNQWPWRDL